MKENVPSRIYDCLSKGLTLQAEFDRAKKLCNCSFPPILSRRKYVATILPGRVICDKEMKNILVGEGAPYASPPAPEVHPTAYWFEPY
jgi:hypothetical protein